MAEGAGPTAVIDEEQPVVPAERASPWARLTGPFLRLRWASILVVAVALGLYFAASHPNFATRSNLLVVAQFTAVTAIIAAGEVMLMICGEIDLSVGNVFARAAFIMYFTWDAGLPLFAGVIAALLASAGVGLVNGLVTVVLRVPSFVTTLGTLFLLNGLTLTISHGFPVRIPEAGSAFNTVMGHGTYSQILWAIGIVAVVQVVLTYTRWGLHTFAVGGNSLGASEAGVNLTLIKIGNFRLASTLAGLAGMLEAFRITSIDPLAGGTNIMFDAVAGAVIGGTALSGGSGTIIGAFLGTIVLSTLRDGFTLEGVSSFTFDLIVGAAILIAMVLNVYLQRLRRSGAV